MSLRLALALALSSSLAAGCYFEEHCVTTQNDWAPADPGPGQRNPNTGQCDFYGGGGTGACGDFGGGSAEPAGASLTDWGICNSYCETLTEADCLQAEECRGAYVDPCGDAQCDDDLSFYECWAITPWGGFSDEGCDTYDAEECARHNECSAVHGFGISGGVGDFGYCIDETGPTDPGSCVGMIACTVDPPDCPEGTVAGMGEGCWTGYCIPLDECESLSACSEQPEEQCVGRADCEPVYEGLDCTCDGEDCTCAEWVFESCS
jgi:hypothetical protein